MSGHNKSGANKKYVAAGHNKYGHNNGAYGDHQKHYGSAAKQLHLSTPYTHYSTNYEPETHYEPPPQIISKVLPVYPAYKPAIYKPEIYQQSYHDDPVISGHYEPTNIQSTYLAHGSHPAYPSASTSYASNSPIHPGVAYY